MAPTSVIVSGEVWSTCLAHALSTEIEEVLGLLLGDTVEDAHSGSFTTQIWAVVPLARVDRRKDRVETTPEQLADASAQAEELTKLIRKKTRVIGWYHSHPHITVLPSHVDLRTQAAFQCFDPGFVGIIFSCFNEDAANKTQRIQVIAFQSVSNVLGSEGGRQSASAQEFGSGTIISTTNLQRNLDGDAFPHQSGTLEQLLNDGNKMDEMETVQLSPGMQQAMHLSTLDMISGEFTRREVPIEVVSLAHLGLQISPPDAFVALQRTLFEEEKAAYSKGISSGSQKVQGMHPLASMHHSATYQVALTKLLEFCILPSMGSLWDKLQENKAKIKRLQHEAQGLQSLI